MERIVVDIAPQFIGFFDIGKQGKEINPSGLQDLSYEDLTDLSGDPLTDLGG